MGLDRGASVDVEGRRPPSQQRALGAERAPAPRTTRSGRLADGAAERSYVAERAAPQLVRSFRLLAAAAPVLAGLITAAELIARLAADAAAAADADADGGAGWPPACGGGGGAAAAAAAPAALAAACALLALAAEACARGWARAGQAEALGALGLVVLQLFGRASLLPPPPPCGPSARAALEDASELRALRHAATLAYAALCTPLRAELCALVGASGLAAILAADAPHGAAPLAPRALAHALLACGLLAAAAARRARWRARWLAAASREGEQRASASELERVSEAKEARSRLIRVVMHDLRSPLLSVESIAAELAEQLRAELAGRPALADVLEEMRALQHCSRLMQGILADMLDFERLDSGRMALAYARVQLSDLFRDAVGAFHRLGAQKAVALRIDVPPELEGACFEGDARRLTQCLNNGLSNALKFTPAGGTVTVQLSYADGDGSGGGEASAGPPAAAPAPGGAEAAADGWRRVRVRVRDTGVGLSAAELRALRSGDAFTQVGAGMHQGSAGTGLGLGIVREMLRLHGGSALELHSAGLGAGLSFDMLLNLRPNLRPEHANPAAASALAHLSALGPRRPSATPQPAPPAPEDAHPALGRSGVDDESGGCARVGEVSRVPRCLYAEDDAVLRRSFSRRTFGKFDAARLALDEAADGEEAMRFALGACPPYDLIVLDNQMPNRSGTEVVRELRAAGFAGAIVGMTGDPKHCDERRAFERAGLTACVDKSRSAAHAVRALLAELAHSGELPPERAAAIVEQEAATDPADITAVA